MQPDRVNQRMSLKTRKKTDVLAHPVHRGIRIYLQQKGDVFEVMKKVHESFSPCLKDALPRLICPTCLSKVKRNEGSYDMDSHLALVSDLQTAACSTSQHKLPKSVMDAFSQSKGGEECKDSTGQPVNMTEGHEELVR